MHVTGRCKSHTGFKAWTPQHNSINRTIIVSNTEHTVVTAPCRGEATSADNGATFGLLATSYLWWPTIPHKYRIIKITPLRWRGRRQIDSELLTVIFLLITAWAGPATATAASHRWARLLKAVPSKGKCQNQYVARSSTYPRNITIPAPPHRSAIERETKTVVSDGTGLEMVNISHSTRPKRTEPTKSDHCCSRLSRKETSCLALGMGRSGKLHA